MNNVGGAPHSDVSSLGTGTSCLETVFRQAESTFEPIATSVPAARQFVASVALPTEGIARQRIELLTSELASNAVLHAQTTFTVTVAVGDACVRISITDASTRPVMIKSYGPTSPTGRGLHLVGSYSDHWGVEELLEGKTVWFELERDT